VTLRAIVRRVSAVFRRRSVDATLDEEVRAHLDLLARDYERTSKNLAAYHWVAAVSLMLGSLFSLLQSA